MDEKNEAGRNTEQPTDYSDETRYNRRKALLMALLRWLECEFFGFFIFLSLLAMRVMLKTKGDIIFGLLGLVTYIMVMADFGIKEGLKARIKNSVRGDNVKRGFGFLLGTVSVLPPLVLTGVLWLSYTGSIGSVLPVFKLLNAGLWGLINLFVPDMDITHLSSSIFWVFPAIQLLLAAVTAFTFSIGISGDDLQTRILYKRK